MRYQFGRFLQVTGMLVAPLGVVGNVLHPQTVTQNHMLLPCFAGLLTFMIGRVVQGPATR